MTGIPDLLLHEWPGSYVMGEEEMEAVSAVLHARSPFRFYGHDVQHYADRVEDFYRDFLGVKHAIAVNSGTAALDTAMAAAEVGPGDEVAIPGYFWVSCASAIVRAGAIPRLVDVDRTFTMDPDDLARKINARTKAVLVVHMAGACGHLDRVAALCQERGVTLIEDVAQANGGSFQGKPLGSWGDLAIFSFQYNKNITCGEGGLVACSDDMLYGRAWATHDLGYARDANGHLDPSILQTWGQGRRMSELSAAMLYAQTQKLADLTAAMRARTQQLYAGLRAIPGAVVREVPDPAGDSGPFVIVTWPDAETATAITGEARANGVRTPSGGGLGLISETGFHIYSNNTSLVEKRPINKAGRPWSDPLNAFAAEIDYGHGALPQLDNLAPRSMMMPVMPTMSADACARIIDIFHASAAQTGLS